MLETEQAFIAFEKIVSVIMFVANYTIYQKQQFSVTMQRVIDVQHSKEVEICVLVRFETPQCTHVIKAVTTIEASETIASLKIPSIFFNKWFTKVSCVSRVDSLSAIITNYSKIYEIPWWVTTVWKYPYFSPAISELRAWRLLPNIRRIFIILLILPVTSVCCERSFSSLRRLKTWKRVTMGEERLCGLATLHVHKENILRRLD